MSVHELQPEAVEARLRAGKKTPNLGKTPEPPVFLVFSFSVLFCYRFMESNEMLLVKLHICYVMFRLM